MSSGIVHTRACLALAAGFTLAALVTQEPSDAQYALGALVGVMVSPDCDVDAGFIAYRYIRRLGVFAERSWSTVWHFYRKSLKHGGELSHFPVVSTLGRLAYLFLFAVIFPTLFFDVFLPIDMKYEVFWWVGKLVQYWKVVVGLMGADFIHYVLDVVTLNDRFDINSLFRQKTRHRRQV